MLARWVRAAHTVRLSFSAEAWGESRPRPASSSTSGRDTLGRRLLKLIFPKRSAVITLRKWAEEGKPLRKYELNSVVRELRNYRRYKHALEVCEWMVTQHDIKLLPGDYAIHLDLISKVHGLGSAEKFFIDLPEQMKGQFTCTSLLHSYVQNNLCTKAEALMDKMKECGFITIPTPYNHMLALYVSRAQLEKIPALVKELKEITSPDILSYNLLLKASATCNDVEGAEMIFLELKKGNIVADWVTYSTLAGIYLKANLVEKAEYALKEMEKRVSKKERVAYCSLITLHANLSGKDEAYRIWKKMKSSFRNMNDAEYTCMISSLVKLGDVKEAESLYDEWESLSGTHDARIPNVLLQEYIKDNTMDKAEKFHELTVQRGITPSYGTWEILAWGYIKAKKMDKVLDCLKNGLSSVRKWEPNIEIIEAVFNNLEMLGDTKGAERFLVILRDAGHVTTDIYNSLLRTYVRAGKMPLIVAERMRKDYVELDEETHKLIRVTSKLRIGEVSTILS
eukprot:TRINITY_DN8471_c0_g1_i3.p1 TRINITY_DN8471_c0_g1~~TRINITY_DN8471_c0_g1_i3.p1  ORF type:complete len:509 (-),score=56.22 TRINITY_DN8471_c0_g1_i3:641-2167(-)